MARDSNMYSMEELFSLGTRIGQEADTEEDALIALAENLIALGMRPETDEELDPSDPDDATLIRAFAAYDAKHKQ